ncbi:LysR substrate-binding domain-containing protein [Cellulosimicrobium cellulans]|uniref:LysR substrate-binding domain-containing protein n=1 Tax=Cellulosimicrobium cellulans TaxID=1710 RepID=UPI0021B100B3|nr:LysR substrate-binding domain-containing protein [Cellulosimicrobium cellulans]
MSSRRRTVSRRPSPRSATLPRPGCASRRASRSPSTSRRAGSRARRSLEGSGPGGGAPDVELVVRNSREVTDLVLDAAVELGFVESATLRRGLRSRTVAHDRLVVVVGPAHRWARRSALRVDELLAGGLVVRERGSGTRETLERGLAAVGERLPDHLPYLGSTAALKTAVQHGGAVAVLSSLAVADDVARGSLVRVAVPGLELDRRLRMVWKDGAALSSGARRIAAAAAASSG